MAFRINKNALLAAKEVHSGWQRQAISPELGQCYVDRLILEPGLSIAYSSYTPNRDLIEESVIEKDTSTLSMTFGLEGKSSYQPMQTMGDVFTFEPNHTTVTTFGTGAGERRYDGNKQVNQLRILVDGSVFERYSIPFHGNASKALRPKQHRHSQTTANSDYYLKRLMSLIASSKTERPLEKNILVLNLLSEQLSLLQAEQNDDQKSIIQDGTAHHQTTNVQDEFRITQAKLFMEQNMEKPLTMAYICQKVSLSESKFKLGFKRIYNITPYQMLLEIRMNKAWELLSTGLQVAQTAYAVGYEHPSNFSAAFTRFHGRSPKSIATLMRQ